MPAEGVSRYGAGNRFWGRKPRLSAAFTAIRATVNYREFAGGNRGTEAPALLGAVTMGNRRLHGRSRPPILGQI